MRRISPTGPVKSSGGFRRLAVFFAAIHFVQGFAEPKAGIAAQPIFFLLRPTPRGPFFSALMSVNNLGTTGSAWLGGRLHDIVGLGWLIAINAATTAACWLLVPWVSVEAPTGTRADAATRG